MYRNTPINLGDIIVSTTRGINSSVIKSDGKYSIRLIKTKDIGENGSFIAGNVDEEFVENLNSCEKNKAHHGEVVIILRGKYRAAVIPEEAEGFILSNNLIAINCKGKYNSEVLASFLNSKLGSVSLEKSAGGNTIPSLNLKALTNIKIPDFDFDEQENLSLLLIEMRKYFAIIEEEKRIFETSIDTIFSKKMEGVDL